MKLNLLCIVFAMFIVMVYGKPKGACVAIYDYYHLSDDMSNLIRCINGLQRNTRLVVCKDSNTEYLTSMINNICTGHSWCAKYICDGEEICDGISCRARCNESISNVLSQYDDILALSDEVHNDLIYIGDVWPPRCNTKYVYERNH